MYIIVIFKHLLLKLLGQSKAKLHVEHPKDVGTNVYINGPGHMTKMAAIAINSKKRLKNFFYRTRKPMILKLCMKHQCKELYKVYKNHDPGMTLTFLRQGQHRSLMHLNGEKWKNVIFLHKLAGNEQMGRIIMFMKKKMAPGDCLPLPRG